MLSLEELLADIEDADANEFVTIPLTPPTQRGYEGIWLQWENYLTRLSKPDLQPTLAVMKGFFKMIATERCGVLNERLAVQSLIAYAIRFKAVHDRKHETSLNSRLMRQLRVWIKSDLARRLKLSTRTRVKPIATTDDLRDLIGYLWMNNLHHFDYERTRIQLAFMIMLLAYTASRPSAIVESNAYHLTGQAMLYKDLKFSLQKDKDGDRPQMSLEVTFNFRKNKRFDDGSVFQQLLFEDRESPDMCPITAFLALAFADHAFSTITDIGQLYDKHICPGKYVDIPFKESILNTPILRNPREPHSIHKTTIVTVSGIQTIAQLIQFIEQTFNVTQGEHIDFSYGGF
ncbi:hypothetical protein SBOR_7778 [Sclerotinia borealis F-4128]|uniref:Uncharacterized protein n=1 Tax=Sclerotinia borealis (strain F-4128) TaxID=1432307 RepID=W9C7M0_SCLBF|nr:hypothetical protein SBOR_7778 [Sclerotinia borealis F-4128]